MLSIHGTRVVIDDKETNFDIRELVTPEMFDFWGSQVIRFLQEDGVRWLQFSREFFDAAHYVNNWHRADSRERIFTLRGVRPYHSGFFTMLIDVHGYDVQVEMENLLLQFGISTATFRTGSWSSIHKNGGAYDYHVKGLSADRVREEILENEQQFIKAGLTTLEHSTFAPTWVHGDNRPTGLKSILIVKPATTR